MRTGDENGPAWKRPEYWVWSHMIERCYNPKAAGYKNYGGRGITVCQRWRESSAAFLADMGSRPSPKHQIDRIDNDRGYSPDNCRWATRIEQCRTRRRTTLLTHDGRTMPFADWVRETGIAYQTIRSRLRIGWTVSEALTRPVFHNATHRRKHIPTPNGPCFLPR